MSQPATPVTNLQLLHSLLELEPEGIVRQLAEVTERIRELHRMINDLESYQIALRTIQGIQVLNKFPSIAEKTPSPGVN